MTEGESVETPTSAPSMPKFQHVILTFFNVRLVSDPSVPSIGTDPAWLDARFALFERYCLPSILAQTQQAFSWILYFDSATPEPYAERARALISKRAGIFPIFSESLSMEQIKETIRIALPEQPQWLLTTRLDNDDGLHAEFVATVQGAQRFGETEFLNCSTGIILRDKRTYRRRDTSNAFISLSEPFTDFETVYVARHTQAREFYPLRQVAKSPLWLQVVHGSNISNRVRGWRIPIETVERGFPIFLDVANGPSNGHPLVILTENLSLYVIRSLRDFAALCVRRGAKLFGVDIRRRATRPRTNASSTS